MRPAQAALHEHRSARTGTFPEDSRRGSAGRAATAQRQGDVQLLEPLFEFSGACARLRRDAVFEADGGQLFGDRTLIANADQLLVDLRRQRLPTSAVDDQPRRPRAAWSNSLFEDNAEFGFGNAPGRGQAGRVRRRTGSAAVR